MTDKKLGALGVIPASILGILSPLCMYGTIQLAAIFSDSGMEDDWLAGLLIRLLYRKSKFFRFRKFSAPENRDTDPNPLLRFLKNSYRNLRATGGYFFWALPCRLLFRDMYRQMYLRSCLGRTRVLAY